MTIGRISAPSATWVVPVKRYTVESIRSDPMSTTLVSSTGIEVSYYETAGATAKNYSTTLTKKYPLKPTLDVDIVPFSFHGVLNSVDLADRDGKVYKNFGGSGTEDPEIVGDINYAAQYITVTDDTFTSDTENLQLSVSHLTGRDQVEPGYGIVFRTPGSPIRAGSLQIKATLADGSIETAFAAIDGNIESNKMKGYIDSSSGLGWVEFGEWVPDGVEAQTMPWYDVDNNDGAGNVWAPVAVLWETILMNCVVVSYLPLDADLLGLDPVRLPLDGKVPIFRDGDIVLIHNTQSLTCPSPLVADQVIDVGRTNVSLIELYDQDSLYVDDIHYTVDLAAGTVTMANPLDLSGYTEPLIAMHRIEDLVLAADIQITGHIGVISPLVHTYPAGTSYVSSVLPVGDLQSRAYNEFEQQTWTGVWSDSLIGDAPLASYDFINYPIIVNNRNSVEERWAIIFTSSTNVQVVGENLGVIAITGISVDIAPLNPNTGEPYFTVDSAGWGSGWSASNVVRFNTKGANYPMWFVRTTLQGEPTENSDQYTSQIRGDSS